MIEKTNLADVNNADDSQWFTIEATVENLESDIHEKMKQKGTLSDETGTITFTNWEVEKLEEGETYIIKDVQTDEYFGNISVNLTHSTEVITENAETVSEKPRASVLNEYSTDTTDLKNTVSVDRFPVTLDDLLVAEPTQIDAIQTENLNKYNVQPLEDALDVSFSNLRVKTSGGPTKDTTYPLEFLGVHDTIAYIGFRFKFEHRIHTISEAQDFIDLQSISDDSVDVSYEGSTKCMNIAVCDNCGTMSIAEDLIDANPYSPSEDYLHFYDWWKETSRHSIPVPECPDCDMKELYPLEVPRIIDLTYEIPIDDLSIDSIESAIQHYVSEGSVNITYTKTEILNIIGRKIVDESHAQDMIESVNVFEPGVGRRYSDAWPKRYIVLQFNKKISEEIIERISEVSATFGEKIFEITDEDDGTRVVFVAHKV